MNLVNKEDIKKYQETKKILVSNGYLGIACILHDQINREIKLVRSLCKKRPAETHEGLRNELSYNIVSLSNQQLTSMKKLMAV